eukprot:jgi/Chlat1/8213/Chrsp76S07636
MISSEELLEACGQVVKFTVTVVGAGARRHKHVAGVLYAVDPELGHVFLLQPPQGCTLGGDDLLGIDVKWSLCVLIADALESYQVLDADRVDVHELRPFDTPTETREGTVQVSKRLAQVRDILDKHRLKFTEEAEAGDAERPMLRVLGCLDALLARDVV